MNSWQLKPNKSSSGYFSTKDLEEHQKVNSGELSGDPKVYTEHMSAKSLSPEKSVRFGRAVHFAPKNNKTYSEIRDFKTPDK